MSADPSGVRSACRPARSLARSLLSPLGRLTRQSAERRPLLRPQPLPLLPLYNPPTLSSAVKMGVMDTPGPSKAAGSASSSSGHHAGAGAGAELSSAALRLSCAGSSFSRSRPSELALGK
jgi:hypothetical protein